MAFLQYLLIPWYRSQQLCPCRILLANNDKLSTRSIKYYMEDRRAGALGLFAASVLKAVPCPFIKLETRNSNFIVLQLSTIIKL